MPRRFDDEDRMIRRIGGNTSKRKGGERERRSWREIDQRRDRGSQTSTSSSNGRTSSDKSPRGRFNAEQARRGHLAAADALFSNPAREDKERQIVAAEPSKLKELVDTFLHEYGWPGNYDVLARLTEHPDPAIVQEALERIGPLFSTASPERQQSLIQSLKLLEMMGKDPATRRAAKRFTRQAVGADVSS